MDPIMHRKEVRALAGELHALADVLAEEQRQGGHDAAQYYPASFLNDRIQQILDLHERLPGLEAMENGDTAEFLLALTYLDSMSDVVLRLLRHTPVVLDMARVTRVAQAGADARRKFQLYFSFLNGM